MNEARVGDELRRAAAEEGIAPDGLLGKFTAAMIAFGERVVAASVDHRAMVQAELARMVAAKEGAEAAARKAEASVRALQVQTEQIQHRTIAGVVDKVADGLREGGVLLTRERRISMAAKARLVAVGAAGAVALLTAGYVASAWQRAEAVAFRDACLRAAVKDANGALFCPLGVVTDGRRT